MRKLFVTTAVIAVIAVIPAKASAHVTVQPSEAIAGGFQTFVVQVPNERDDASTTKIQVEFPQEFASVSFQPKDGWKRDVKIVQFDEPIEAFGEEVTEGVGTVTWSGGEIGPGEFETFAFSVGPVPEGDLEFPAIQTYSSGEVVRWIGPADSDEPAALVSGVDLGLEEGRGQLSAIAALGNREESGTDDDGPDDAEGTTEVLDYIALSVAALALLIALMSRGHREVT